MISYEEMQESPFNKGAVSEADWGFLKFSKFLLQQLTIFCK